MKHERKVEKERTEFKQLLRENPNYFGNVTDEKLAGEFTAVAPIAASNKSYEELRCVGLYPEENLLEAVLEIKRPFGYQGPLCSEGSTEYVAFYIDWRDGAGYQSVGAATQVNVHDLSFVNGGHVFYAVRKGFIPKQLLKCQTPQIVSVRAILSWEAVPTSPAYVPVWGNVVEASVQIKKKEIGPLVFSAADLKAAQVQELTDLGPEETVFAESPGDEVVLVGDSAQIKKYLDASLAAEEKAREEGKLEPERLDFKALIQKNPNHFGSISESEDPEELAKAIYALPPKVLKGLIPKLEVDPKALLPFKIFLGKTRFEQLNCVGLYPESDLLEAVIEVKRSSGYGGDLCTLGSREWVAFYVDWGDGAGFVHAATTNVRVHDIPGTDDEHLFYAVRAVIHPPLEKCTTEQIVRVKAILSWNLDPTPYGHTWAPTWGNVLTRNVQIRPEDGASVKCTVEAVNEVHAADIAQLGASRGLGIKIAAGGVSVPGTFDRPFGGTVGVWGNINVPAASYYRFLYQEVGGGGGWTPVTDDRRARGLFGFTIFRSPDADGWFSRSDYDFDLANYTLQALVHWNSRGKNGLYRLRLQLGDALKNELPDPCEFLLLLDNVGPELLDFSGTPAPLPATGVAVKDSTGAYRKCTEFVGPEEIQVWGNFRDDYFRRFDLIVFGGNIAVSGVSIGSGRYDDPALAGVINSQGIVGAISGVAGPGRQIDSLNLCTIPQSPQKVKCAYGVRLRVWDRSIVGHLRGYEFDTSTHGRTAFVTFDWDPTGCP